MLSVCFFRLIIVIPLLPNIVSILPCKKYISPNLSLGIRHGRIIPGDENNAYEIFNSSVPLFEDRVERGVLARVASELLKIDKSSNQGSWESLDKYASDLSSHHVLFT
jgi:hypothetical protein